MSNYALLRSKIQTDHAGDTAQQIVTALNDKAIPSYKNIDTADIKRYLIVNDLLLPIKTSVSPACIVTMDALSVFPYFQIGIAEIRNKLIAMMDALIAENLAVAFTEQNKADVLAMGDVLLSWSDQNWNGAVQIWQVEEALK